MRIFVSQAMVDRWMAAGGLSLTGDSMVFAAAPQLPLSIMPGVYFERIDGGEQDPYDIIGAVKTADELGQMGADHYEASVVLEEFAYTVKPGFVALPQGPGGGDGNLDGQSWGALLYAMESLGTG